MKSYFLTSAISLESCPNPHLPEVALVGRSNVGKSSLINDLLQNPSLARTSSTPGKTRLINFFSVDDKFYLVDLPGYGYAKGDTRSWQQMIEGYLKERTTLRLILLLVDSRRGMMEDDIRMHDWIVHHHLPLCLILTKVDKLSCAEQELLDPSFIAYSVKKPRGRAGVLKKIHDAIK